MRRKATYVHKLGICDVCGIVSFGTYAWGSFALCGKHRNQLKITYKVKLYFKKHKVWIGWYYTHKILHIQFLPMCGLKIWKTYKLKGTHNDTSDTSTKKNSPCN